MNGKPAPMDQLDWPGLVQGLRDASQATYKAAQTKNQDAIVDAAGTLTEACAACHDKVPARSQTRRIAARRDDLELV